MPLSVHNHVPYLEADPRWVNETSGLNSVGFNHDEGTSSLHVAYAPYDRLTAAAATREPDDDISWIVVVGHEEASHGGDAYEADE